MAIVIATGALVFVLVGILGFLFHASVELMNGDPKDPRIEPPGGNPQGVEWLNKSVVNLTPPDILEYIGKNIPASDEYKVVVNDNLDIDAINNRLYKNYSSKKHLSDYATKYGDKSAWYWGHSIGDDRHLWATIIVTSDKCSHLVPNALFEDGIKPHTTWWKKPIYSSFDPNVLIMKFLPKLLSQYKIGRKQMEERRKNLQLEKLAEEHRLRKEDEASKKARAASLQELSERLKK